MSFGNSFPFDLEDCTDAGQLEIVGVRETFL